MTAVREIVTWTLARAGRAIPTNSGLARVGGNGLARRLCDDGRDRTCRLRSGMLACVRTDSIIGRTLYLCGDYDPKVSKLCSAPLCPGDTMVDIGAQFGDTALPATMRVGPDGLVHAFEPNPRSASLLRRAIGLNKISNMRVHEVALSDSDGEHDLFVPDGSPEAGTLTDRNASRSGEHIRIVTRKTSDYLREIGVTTCRVLKLDVEGHEGAVLRGAVDFLRDHPPHVVIFESERRRGPFGDREEVVILRNSGYTIYQVMKSLWRLRLRIVPDDFPSQGSSYDFVAVHKDAPRGVRRRLGLPETDR